MYNAIKSSGPTLLRLIGFLLLFYTMIGSQFSCVTLVYSSYQDKMKESIPVYQSDAKYLYWGKGLTKKEGGRPFVKKWDQKNNRTYYYCPNETNVTENLHEEYSYEIQRKTKEDRCKYKTMPPCEDCEWNREYDQDVEGFHLTDSYWNGEEVDFGDRKIDAYFIEAMDSLLLFDLGTAIRMPSKERDDRKIDAYFIEVIDSLLHFNFGSAFSMPSKEISVIHDFAIYRGPFLRKTIGEIHHVWLTEEGLICLEDLKLRTVSLDCSQTEKSGDFKYSICTQTSAADCSPESFARNWGANKQFEVSEIPRSAPTYFVYSKANKDYEKRIQILAAWSNIYTSQIVQIETDEIVKQIVWPSAIMYGITYLPYPFTIAFDIITSPIQIVLYYLFIKDMIIGW
ncbi:hypothetical protein LEP1GSC161_1146 [Leptospira santarosai str. CBC1416]|uniref:Uncharacterized protein n=3 Tax=Leptospira santarosai TaxID=28183 RepID=M6VTK0_9LEPT|nr:hypothetical protein LEP1GSC161_1146 [Leptospira santarosai str. CBC1416]